MSEKTEQKRQLILDSARNVFAAKGYRAVTMKDIVEASQISRGGLYLYFSSVEEVFLAVLEMEEKKSDEEVLGEALEDATNGEIQKRSKNWLSHFFSDILRMYLKNP